MLFVVVLPKSGPELQRSGLRFFVIVGLLPPVFFTGEPEEEGSLYGCLGNVKCPIGAGREGCDYARHIDGLIEVLCLLASHAPHHSGRLST